MSYALRGIRNSPGETRGEKAFQREVHEQRNGLGNGKNHGNAGQKESSDIGL